MVAGTLILALMASPAWGADSREAVTLAALTNARLAEAAGEPQSALAALTVVASHAPDSPGLNVRLLDSAIRAGDLAAANSAAVKLWRDGDNRVDVRLTLLADAIRRSDWKSARAYIDDNGGKVGRDTVSRLIAPAVTSWIGVAMRATTPESALLSDTGSAASDAVYGLTAAQIQLMTRRKKPALAQIDTVSLVDLSSQMMAIRVAASLREKGMPSEADSLLKRVKAAASRGVDPILLLPEQPAQNAAAGIAQWFAMLSDGLAHAPNANPRIVLLFARVSQWIDPQDWQGRLALAEALVKSKQSDAAIALLAAPGGRVPPVVAMRRAELVADSGDLEAGIAMANTAVASQDIGRGLLIRYADLARQSGNQQAAMAALDRLADTLSDTGEDRELRGQLLVSKADLLLKDHQWDAAEPLLEKAVELLPDDASTLNFAGYSALERRKNVPQAMKRIEMAWQLQPQSPGIMDSLGWANFVTGNYSKAVELLERAMRSEPGNAVIVEHLGDAYWQAGQKFGARYQWRAAALLAEDPMAGRIATKLRDGLTLSTTAP